MHARFFFFLLQLRRFTAIPITPVLALTHGPWSHAQNDQQVGEPLKKKKGGTLPNPKALLLNYNTHPLAWLPGSAGGGGAGGGAAGGGRASRGGRPGRSRS